MRYLVKRGMLYKGQMVATGDFIAGPVKRSLIQSGRVVELPDLPLDTIQDPPLVVAEQAAPAMTSLDSVPVVDVVSTSAIGAAVAEAVKSDEAAAVETKEPKPEEQKRHKGKHWRKR